jgi:hypothetical protein
MAAEARYAAPKTPGAPTNPATSAHTLSPEDFAEFIDSLREDEAPAEATGCTDCDREYND